MGIVIALNPQIAQNQTAVDVFAMSLVIFIVGSILAYSALLFGNQWKAYRLDIFLISVSLSVMLTLAFATPLVHALAGLGLSQDEDFVIYAVIVTVFLATFMAFVFTNLSYTKALRNSLQPEAEPTFKDAGGTN